LDSARQLSPQHRTACPAVVDPPLDFAEWALSLDHRSNCTRLGSALVSVQLSLTSSEFESWSASGALARRTFSQGRSLPHTVKISYRFRLASPLTDNLLHDMVDKARGSAGLSPTTGGRGVEVDSRTWLNPQWTGCDGRLYDRRGRDGGSVESLLAEPPT
jgi:hypothetical protein